MATRFFVVSTTARFERLFRSLRKRHPELSALRHQVSAVLQADPYNRSGAHSIKKLTAVKASDGQYRLRIGRWRFRYDVHGWDVVLYSCGIRDESTYP